MNPPEIFLDHRARHERDLLEAAERRERARIEQRSPENSPEMRVRIWEKLHQVRLPRSEQHAILRTVADQTGLAMSEIQGVQRDRALVAGGRPQGGSPAA